MGALQGLASVVLAFLTPEPVFLSHPEGGFATFGPQHLCMLAIMAALSVVLLRAFRRLPAGWGRGTARHRFLVTVAAVPLALLGSRDSILIARGLMTPNFWPLHICNICEFLNLALAVSESRHIARVAYPWGMVGGIGALLLPGWTYCPVWSYASVGGFVEHALMVVCCLCMVGGGLYRPRLRHLWEPTVAAVTGGLLFRILNPVLGTNFFFVTQPVAAPFVWGVRRFGDPGFLVIYLLIALALWCAFDGMGLLLRGTLVCPAEVGDEQNLSASA
ncbi:TMEM164 family acyltransferase [Olsenella porci]|uniref:YwaF family protein n=1 Tax=Olsenella porci TaxID=2652279 RepID=A0A6N7XBN3_9ACTN|nr:YwaF family protein [Olsenella porci]MST73002.1 YwaF family protein [Olsenella porci]